MSKGYSFGNEEVQEESSWRYPLAIFFATLILCAIFLYHYVGPGVDEIQGETPKPTISNETFQLKVGDRYFDVPANYTVYPKDRRDAERNSVTLYALWPNMKGYTPATRDEFIHNEPDTRRIDIYIDQRATTFSEEMRIEELYMPNVIDKRGTRSDYQLTKFTFKEGRPNQPVNGYSNYELYIGQDTDENTVALFCDKPENSVLVPPNCWREVDISPRLSVKYYFKLPYLPEWRQIDNEVRKLIKDMTV